MKKDYLKERETFHLEIPADENNLSEVRDFIADICRKAGFSKRETNNTKLAMDEACTNIIKHAYHSRGGVIRIDVQAEPGNVEINIFDRGEAFDWGQVEDPDLERYVEMGKRGGLGIFLMNRLMDDLDYQTSDAGNRLYMAKSVDIATRRPLFVSIKPRWISTLRFKFGLRAGLGLLGLVLFLWGIQYINQTRVVDSQRSQAWVDMRNFARSLEAKSENALVIDDLYHPEYREMTDFIMEQLEKVPQVKYARIVNSEGIIVSSSNVEEFQEEYEVPRELGEITTGGDWRTVRDAERGTIKEFHMPIRLSADGSDHVVTIGRVVIGVSEAMIEEGINDPRLKTSMILLGIFMVGVSLIYLLISILVKPIQALTDGVRAIGEGSLEDEIKIEGPEEIGAIASAFNDITAKFREAQKSVVEQERVQKEMQVAQEIQHSLLPGKVPKISGYDIGSLYRAAKEVGGDYYDFVNVDEDTLGVVVADVSGKGVPGSLVMTMIRTALRMEARGSLSAAEVMARMNDFVTEDMKKGMFVTIFYVILDSKNRIISYASAGHNPMILYRAESDETFFLNPRGFPVGISLPDITLFRRSIDVEKIKLKKDDMLVIYTDGVTEAMNESRKQYGEERLIQLIKKHGRLAPEEFIDRLSEDIGDFTGDYPQNDDITVVAIKEKLMADDVLFGIRKKLLDLVDMEGLTVAEACRRMRVSPSTYYRYKRRLVEMGERGLKNKTLREEHEIRRVSLEQRKEMLEIIKSNPRFGAKRIATFFNEGKGEEEQLSSSLVYDELKRMRLNTFERRLEYLRRNRIISEDEFQALLASPASRLAPKPETQAGDERTAEPVEGGVEAVAGDAVPVFERKPGVEGIPGMAVEKESFLQALDVEREGGSVVEIESRELEGGIVVLTARGHLDSSSAGELEGILESVYEYGYRKIIVELNEVSYVSSGGWGIFTGRVNTLREGEGDVVLVGMSPEVYDIYELLGFRDIIMHFQNVDEAVEFLSLPFGMRQERLKRVSQAGAKTPVVEQRMAVADSPGPEEEEGALYPWTPLKIEAGTVGESGEITILNLDGVIDTVSCVKLRKIMDDLVGKGRLKLVMDMSKVEYVSSSGWGVFASKIDDIRQGGGDIKIFGMDPEVDGIFHLLGFDVIMRSFSILAEAIDDFKDTVAVGRGLFEDGWEPALDGEPGYDDIGIAGPEPSLGLELSVVEPPVEGLMVLRVGGAIDAATAEGFEGRMDRFMKENPANFIVDLSDVVYISSSGWGVIVKYMQRLNDRGGRMVLTGMSPTIFKIFCDLGFESLIPHYLSIDKAEEELAVRGFEAAGADVEGDTGERVPGENGDIDSTGAGRAAVSGEACLPPPGEAAGAPDTKPEEAGVDEEIDAPRVVRTGVTPLTPLTPEKEDDKVIILDFDKNKDLREDKDKRIRELGWSEYGRKLYGRDKGSRKNKKKSR